LDFDWETAIYSEDIRTLYPERRFVAVGYLGFRLHVLCFTPIEGGIRVISFRKANIREVKRYEKNPLTNKERVVRELIQEDIQAMRSPEEVIPEELLKILPKRKVGQRGMQKQPKKVPITLRYSPDVVEYFKSTGEGWQIRMDEALKEWIKNHPRAA
jgi:uncharacterized protein (DUF4415 family)